jgi:hypothetical protein
MNPFVDCNVLTPFVNFRSGGSYSARPPPNSLFPLFDSLINRHTGKHTNPCVDCNVLTPLVNFRSGGSYSAWPPPNGLFSLFFSLVVKVHTGKRTNSYINSRCGGSYPVRPPSPPRNPRPLCAAVEAIRAELQVRVRVFKCYGCVCISALTFFFSVCVCSLRLCVYADARTVGPSSTGLCLHVVHINASTFGLVFPICWRS